MKKLIIVLILSLVIISLFGCGSIPKSVTVDGVTAITTMELKNWQQTDSPWGTQGIGGNDNIWCTGCGILAASNAIHYATGYFLDPGELANWAYENEKGYKYKGTNGQKFYYYCAETFGETCGFKNYDAGTLEDNGLPCVRVIVSGKSAKDEMIEFLEGGATMVGYVKNHYVAIVDYDSTSDRFLVWDNCAGLNDDGSPGLGGNRMCITHRSGDWFTFEEMRGTLANGSGSLDYFKLYYYVPIIPTEGNQLFHVERTDLKIGDTKLQETGKACNFTKVDLIGHRGETLTLSGSYSSKATSFKIGYKIEGGETIYDGVKVTSSSSESRAIGTKWCGSGTKTSDFEVSIPVEDTLIEKYEIVVNTDGVERVIWTIIR